MDDKLIRLARKVKTLEDELSHLSQIKDLEGLLVASTDMNSRYKKSINEIVGMYKEYISNTKKELTDSFEAIKKEQKEKNVTDKKNIDNLEAKINKVKDDIQKVCTSIDKSIEDIQKDILKDIKDKNTQILNEIGKKDKELKEVRQGNSSLSKDLKSLKDLVNKLELQKGDDGKSAYDIACELGFKGTKEEWIKSLHGKDGQDIELRGLRAFSDVKKDNKSYIRKNKKWEELRSDLIDDTDQTNKFVTSEEKATWNAKQNALIFDNTPTENSTNPVTSGGIYNSQAEQNTQITALQTENTRLKATLPTTTGEGENITLSNTANLEFIQPPLPRGNSEQDGEPTPTTPIAISNVTGDVEVLVQNKNLFDRTKMPNAQDWATFPNGKQLFIKVKPNTEYTLSSNVPQSSNNLLYFNGTSTQANGVYNGKTVTQTSDNEGNIYVGFFTNRDYYNDVVNGTYYIQLEQNTTATTYTPHQEQTFTFPLGSERLMLGDYLADDGIHHVRLTNNLKDLTWRLRNTNSEGISTYQATLTGRKYASVLSSLSNYFTFLGNVTGTAQMYEKGEGFGYYYNPNYSYDEDIYLNIKISTLAELQTWLNNNNPLVEYELATEEITPYTTEQQQAYDEIKQAISYEEQTNISGSSDESNPLLSVEAYQSIKLILAS